MAQKGWDRRFEDPIDLPGGRQLVTLQDAGDYITKLPPRPSMWRPNGRQRCRRWCWSHGGGPTMLARIGVMRALRRHDVREFNPDRKATVNN
jgi:hypothetical protein